MLESEARCGAACVRDRKNKATLARHKATPADRRNQRKLALPTTFLAKVLRTGALLRLAIARSLSECVQHIQRIRFPPFCGWRRISEQHRGRENRLERR